MRIRKHLILSILIFILVIVLGAYAYRGVEGWRLLDSFYFVAVTVTTIGYGEIVPVTDTGKIFTIFYSFFGVGMAFYFLTLLGTAMFKKHVSGEVSVMKREVRKEEEIKEAIEESKKKPKRRKKKVSKRKR